MSSNLDRSAIPFFLFIGDNSVKQAGAELCQAQFKLCFAKLV